MSRNAESEPIEEIRLLVANPHTCAEIAEAFVAEGIAAYGDFRDEPAEVLIRDAYEDRVDYVLYMNLRDLFDNFGTRRKGVRDLIAKVYLRREGEVKIMSVGAAIKMIQQRRLMPPR
ncbi:MAG: hypothetical protein FJ276_35630 [Planctomycetes bacterium]|nr:hypothetical protein [Planctomycetota bacterium]